MHDAHIHLAMEPLKSNLHEVMDNFLCANGKYILTQSTDLDDIDTTLKISKKYPKNIHPSLGLHPTIFEENTVYKNKTKNITRDCNIILEKFEAIFSRNIPFIKAVGETGLDYYQMNIQKDIPSQTGKELEQVQKNSFRRHLKLALDSNLPLSIHARDVIGSDKCVKDVIQLVAEEGRGLARGCFHSYTGDVKQIPEILSLGFHIGFNAIITYKSGGDVREILRKTPIERILFETDGPFLPTQSVRKNKKIKVKYAQPSDIKEIIAVAAEVKNLDPKELERRTDENYERVFLKEEF